MAIVPSDWLNVNRISWNQRTKLHINSDFYDVERFKKGKDSLNDIELQLLGNIDKTENSSSTMSFWNGHFKPGKTRCFRYWG